jgi:ABC-2 type transport system permease protein
MADLLHLFRAEFLKLSSTRTALGLFIAALVVSVVPAVLVMSLVPRHALADGGSALAATGLTIVPILAVVFGILGMTNEYRHGTITYTYLTTPRRGIVIVVKLICYGIVGTAVMAATALLVVLAIDAIGALRDIALPWLTASTISDLQTLRDAGMFLVAAGMMTAFGVSLGALFRAQVPTVAGVVVWALAVESIITVIKPRVGIYLPFAAFQQLTMGGTAHVGEPVDLPSLTRPEAFLVSLAYIAVFSVAAVFTSMRRDVT